MVRWLAASLGYSIVLLAVFAPSLAVIVPEQPNDHYHAFLDPVVMTLVAVGIARLAGAALPRANVRVHARSSGRSGRRESTQAARDRARDAGRGAVAAVRRSFSGSPSRRGRQRSHPTAAGPSSMRPRRVLEATGEEPFLLDGIPDFKYADALRFPLERREAQARPAIEAGTSGVVVLVSTPCSTRSWGRRAEAMRKTHGWQGPGARTWALSIASAPAPGG